MGVGELVYPLALEGMVKPLRWVILSTIVLAILNMEDATCSDLAALHFFPLENHVNHIPLELGLFGKVVLEI